jgi:hypothetical protein
MKYRGTNTALQSVFTAIFYFVIANQVAIAADNKAVLFTLNSVQERCNDYSSYPSQYVSYAISGALNTHIVSGDSATLVASCDSTSAKLLGTCNIQSGQGGILYYYESQAYRHVAVAEQECLTKSGAVWTAGPNYPGTWWPLNCQNDNIAMEGTTCRTWTGSNYRTLSAKDCNGSASNPSSAGYYIVPSCPSSVPGVGTKKGTCILSSGTPTETSITYYKQEICVYHGQCSPQTPPGTCDMIGGLWTSNAVTQNQLSLSLTGNGEGSVNILTPSSPVINCVSGSSCNPQTYDTGTSITFQESPSIGSVFGNWGNCTDNGNATCTLSLGTDTTVTARFDSLQWFRAKSTDNVYFGSLANAYGKAGNNDTIQMKINELTGNVLFDRDVSITLDGGLDSNWNRSGFTSINGTIKVSKGRITIQGVKVY